MAEICFITTCMGRLDHLRDTLPTVASQTRSSCVVVDYSCPQRSGDWVERAHPGVKVVRVPGQSRFGLGRARTAGAKAADAPWLGFVDADVALDPSFTAEVLPLLRPGHFYRAAPFARELCGTVLIPAEDFALVGGYDAVIEGWGWEDMDLFHRLEFLGLVEAEFPARLLRPIPHPYALRVEHYEVKEIPVSLTTNFVYSQAKLDLMRLTGRTPNDEFLRDLYGRIDRLARDWGRDGEARDFFVHFRKDDARPGAEVTASLRYAIGPAG